MFSTITWEQYFFFVGFALIAYYIFVGVKFFKWELLALAGIEREEKTSFSNVVIPKFSTPVSDDFSDESEVDLSPVLQDFRDEIGAFAAEAVVNQLPRQEVIHGIQLIASKYPVLNTAAQESIRNEIILQELHGANYTSINYKDLLATNA